MENHDVKIRGKVMVQTNEIRLYHYHVQNYTQNEEKVKRYVEVAKRMPENQGMHIKEMIALYEAGKLREYYDSLYGEQQRLQLMEKGVVSRDPSVSLFLKYAGII